MKDYPCDKVLYGVVIYVVRHNSGQKPPECDQCEKKIGGGDLSDISEHILESIHSCLVVKSSRIFYLK